MQGSSGRLTVSVDIDDALLPAASHLTGPESKEILRQAISAIGGELVSSRISQVQYRPTSDLIVRYRCEIRTGDTVTTSTIFAGTTPSGAHVGTLPVEAETGDGVLLQVGVWRWPFDPILQGLDDLVIPGRAARLLGEVVGESPRIDVVVYRPTERAVVHVSGSRGETYVKVVPPSTRSGLELRHLTLSEAGIPVARILKTGPGWLAMTALTGTTLRDRLKQPSSTLLPPDRVADLLDRLAPIRIEGASPVRSRITDAAHHAAMIARVFPTAKDRLDRIVESLGSSANHDEATTIHGDLHEAQLVIDDDSVIGLLDIDDAGPGNTLDDIGTFVAHLEYRTLVTDDLRIGAYAKEMSSVLGRDLEPVDVRRHVAASLVGLATGPFRLQHKNWEKLTDDVIGRAEKYVFS